MFEDCRKAKAPFAVLLRPDAGGSLSEIAVEDTGPALARRLGLRGTSGTDFLRHATHLDGTAYRAHLLDTLDQLPLRASPREALLRERGRP